MRHKGLKIYRKDNLNSDTKREIAELNQQLYQVIYVTKDYDTMIAILEEKAKEFTEKGIYTDIYYKIYNLKNRASDQNISVDILQKIRNIYDVYSECINQKDYRNAARMLHYYQQYTFDEYGTIDLQRAKLYTKLSDFEKAEKYLEQCRKTQEKNPNFVLIQIELFFKKKQYRKVISLLPKLDCYDGRNNYQAYVTVVKACLLEKKYEQAEEVFTIIQGIIEDHEFAIRLISKIKQDVKKEYCRRFPTQRNIAASFDIACDEGNLEEAEKYLAKLLTGEQKEEFLESDQDKVKKLGELKTRIEMENRS